MENSFINTTLNSLDAFQRMMNVAENDSTIEMTKAVNRILKANPEKMHLFIEHSVAFKWLLAASEEKRRLECEKLNEKRKLTLVDTDSLQKSNDLSLCLKRNFKELTFTSRKTLEERKRLLLEIQEENLKYINLSGDLHQIKKVLFD